jgi:hypothetical protein
MSSSATKTYIIGMADENGDMPKLEVSCKATDAPCLKGNYIIEDVIFGVSGATPKSTKADSCARTGGIAGIIGTDNGSMTIKNNGTFIWNGAKVQLVGSENGESTLELYDAVAGEDIVYKVDSGTLTRVEVKIDE